MKVLSYNITSVNVEHCGASLSEQSRAVVLNCSLNGHMEYVRQIYYIYIIYMKIALFNSLVWGSLRLAPII